MEQQGCDFRQHVYDKWRQNKGHCQDCPNRDPSLYWRPNLGAFDPDADLLILGDTPNHREDGEHRSRQIYDADRDKPRPQRSSQKYGREIILDKKVFDDYHDVFFSTPSRIKAVTVTEDGVEGLYFTNSKKCGDINNQSEKNSQARDCCGEYLQKEIEWVDPKVILALGREATEAFFAYTNYFTSPVHYGPLYELMFEDPDTSHVPDFLSHEASGKTVIFGYHWSRGNFHRNISWRPFTSSQYFEGLVEAINKAL